MATRGTLINGVYYNFDANGVMQTGWSIYNNSKYYINFDGNPVKGWKLIDNQYYYFNNNGIMQTGWVPYGGKWFYLDSTGVMQTGWLNVGGTWYYLNSAGEMQTGWLNDNGTWYYLNSEGKMQTGWLQVGQFWYYLGNDGKMIASSWLQLNGYWYFLNEAGIMATGWTHDGNAWYFLDKYGHWDGKPGIIDKITTYNIDFNQVVNKQTSVSPKADGAGLFIASREAVAYYLNPNNFKRGTNEYLQFLVLSLPANLDPTEVNQKILAGKGILEGQGRAFVDAGKKYSLNEAYLIAHALHETGNGTSPLAMGIPVDANGNVTRDANGNIAVTSNTKHTVYNMFGYGAKDGNAIDGGAKYAFNHGWFSPYDAIVGGAANISSSYIQSGQDTLYKMKWNPDNPGTHQYATHIQWAVLQTAKIAAIYNLLDNYVLTFDIPEYKNQPGETTKPTGEALYAVEPVQTGLTATVNADPSLRIRSYPNGEQIGSLPYGLTVNVLGKNGGWYKVRANVSGAEITGWVSGQYLSF